MASEFTRLPMLARESSIVWVPLVRAKDRIKQRNLFTVMDLESFQVSESTSDILSSEDLNTRSRNVTK